MKIMSLYPCIDRIFFSRSNLSSYDYLVVVPRMMEQSGSGG